MNFLGHCLFSEPTPAALIGSLWPDFDKRPEPSLCSAVFNVHFDRHQRIDKITDNHILLEPLRSQLRPTFRKTTPIVVDMILDHHLAKHWQHYHQQTLASFAEQTYQNLALFDELPLNTRFEKSIYWMAQYNWFESYGTEKGIMRALEGMAERIRFKNPLHENRHQIPAHSRAFATDLDAFIQYLQQTIDPNQSL